MASAFIERVPREVAVQIARDLLTVRATGFGNDGVAPEGVWNDVLVPERAGSAAINAPLKAGECLWSACHRLLIDLVMRTVTNLELDRYSLFGHEGDDCYWAVRLYAGDEVRLAVHIGKIHHTPSQGAIRNYIGGLQAWVGK